MRKEIFTTIYTNNWWNSSESRSGEGSELKSTQVLRQELPFLFKKYNIQSILDIPCGDFNWMKEVDLSGINYVGADIVDDLIASNKVKYPQHNFIVLDLVNDPLPKADLVFVRDCLVHLSNASISQALENIKKSGSKYLLTTSFVKLENNTDILDGSWRVINLLASPFKMTPIYLINEDCRVQYPDYNDKCMLLFDLRT